MKRFVKVTVYDEKTDSNQIWHINPDHIVALGIDSAIGDHPGVHLVTGKMLPAIESVQEIMDQINPPSQEDNVGAY